jgi:hypothetical protein
MTSTNHKANRGSKAAAIIITLALAAAANAAQVETLYLPAAAHVAGMNGAQWRTDVSLYNTSANVVTYTIEMLTQDADNTAATARTFTLASGQSIAHNDVIDTVFAAAGSAALRITADGALAASARTYNQTAQGTYGQLIEAGKADEAIKAGTTATIFPLAGSPSRDRGFRTNLGFVNATAAEINIEVSLHRATGEQVSARTVTLKPFSFNQINDAYGKAGAGEIEAGFAKVRTTTTDGAVLAYASVIDNLSGDPLYVAAE